MKPRFVVWSLLALTASVAPPASAQAESPSNPLLAESIRALEEQEREAVLAGDTGTLERLWSGTLVVNNPQSTISADRNVVLTLIRDGRLRYASFERTIERIRFDSDIAIVMGSEVVVPAADAPRAGQTIHRRFTNIWRARDHTWVMIARHANVIPPK